MDRDRYTYYNVWVNAWTTRGKHVKMGFSVDLSAFGAGEIGPSCEFSREHNASSEWHHTIAKVCAFLSYSILKSNLRIGARLLKSFRELQSIRQTQNIAKAENCLESTVVSDCSKVQDTDM